MKSDDIKNKWMRGIQRTTGFFHTEALCKLRLKIDSLRVSFLKASQL